MKDEKYNWKSITVGFIVILLGILAVLVDYFLLKTPQNLWISIGCSLVASGLVIFLTAIFLEKAPYNPLEEWGIEKIYSTRAEKEADSDRQLEDAKYRLDVIAFGLKTFRSRHNKQIEECLNRGVNIRILTMKPDSKWVIQREIEEKETRGQIKHTIEELVKWADELNEKSDKGKIVVCGYDAMTLDFYWRVDENLYVGPYWYGIPSQQTITYKFNSKGKAFTQFTGYFEELWENNELCKPLTKYQSLE